MRVPEITPCILNKYLFSELALQTHSPYRLSLLLENPEPNCQIPLSRFSQHEDSLEFSIGGKKNSVK